MTFSSEQLNNLRTLVAGYMSDGRYKHTLGVERAARRIGDFFSLEDVSQLSAAALLHDIAKEFSRDEQLSLIHESCFSLTDEDFETFPALHSFAAPTLVRRDFPEFATDDVLSAVFNHTLGAPDMSVFDEIIFVADFIEEGRTYDCCAEVREELFSALSQKNRPEENLRALHLAVISAISSTVKSLESKGRMVNSRTKLTKNAFLALI